MTKTELDEYRAGTAAVNARGDERREAIAFIHGEVAKLRKKLSAKYGATMDGPLAETLEQAGVNLRADIDARSSARHAAARFARAASDSK